MKKLYLKSGLFVYATATEQQNGRRIPQQIIAVYEVADEKPGELLYSVQQITPLHNVVVFRNNPTELAWYEIQQIAEIIENFNQYFNNLNQ